MARQLKTGHTDIMWTTQKHDSIYITTPDSDPGTNATAIEALFDNLIPIVSTEPDATWLIDASPISTISSLAVARLISAVRVVDLAGGRIAMAGVKPFVSNVLKTTRIVKVLHSSSLSMKPKSTSLVYEPSPSTKTIPLLFYNFASHSCCHYCRDFSDRRFGSGSRKTRPAAHK